MAFSSRRCAAVASTAATRSIRSTAPAATAAGQDRLGQAGQRPPLMVVEQARAASRRRTRVAPAPQADRRDGASAEAVAGGAAAPAIPAARPLSKVGARCHSTDHRRSCPRRELREVGPLYHSGRRDTLRLSERGMAQKTDPSYDVIVVGSGASGGWAAKRLAEAGVNVALVEAGRPHRPDDFREHRRPFDLPYGNLSRDLLRRTRPRQTDCYACTEYNADWFANDLEEPYTTPADKPFSWQGRLRLVGGRTNVWARQSYRLSEQDLKGAVLRRRRRGLAARPTPTSRPYYDLVEDYVGISGQAEGVPELPDGQFLPPMPMTCAETRLRARVKNKLGRTITIGRTANLTRPINGRSACHYCGPCERGCVDAVVLQLGVHDGARCDGHREVHAHHQRDGLPGADGRATTSAPPASATSIASPARRSEVQARAVVLCAQALESARILLNSATRQQPNGLANSSGALGHYLMDHLWVAGGAEGEFPDFPRRARSTAPRAAERHLRHSVPQHHEAGRAARSSCAAMASRAASDVASTGRRRVSASGFKKACSIP